MTRPQDVNLRLPAQAGFVRRLSRNGGRQAKNEIHHLSYRFSVQVKQCITRIYLILFTYHMNIVVTSLVENFISSLEEPTIAKVVHNLELLEQHAFLLSMPYSKKIAPDLFELRTRGKQEIRLFYTFKNKQIIVFYGFIKKSQQTPLKELRQAKRLLAQI